MTRESTIKELESIFDLLEQAEAKLSEMAGYEDQCERVGEVIEILAGNLHFLYHQKNSEES